MRLIVYNPNTSADTTERMVAIAAAEAGARARLEGVTASFGAPLITEPEALAMAARAASADAHRLAGADAVIVAAFGDPGIEALRARLTGPVTGLAEASMAEAAADGRRFAVVTTTPALAEAIAGRAAELGHTGFAGVWTTPGDPIALTAAPAALRAALAEACRRAAIEGCAEAIVIGGGPLAEAARDIAASCPVPLIEPVPAAVRRSLAWMARRTRSD